MLMAWAKKKDTPYVQDPVFQKNFLADLRNKEIGNLAPHLDYTLADIDFAELNAIADREKTANLSPEEKKKRSAERKVLRDELKAKFGTAVVDGNEVEVGAYLAEPPGILMGRGNHPLRGKWKQRVEPGGVTLNLDESAPKPPTLDRHDWKDIVHDHDSMWIASWWDDLSKKRKYVWLAETSHLRQERDQEKYLKAATLESDVEKVRDKIRAGMRYTDIRVRQQLEQSEKKVNAAIKERMRKFLPPPKPETRQDVKIRR
jgi:DNA topoisomerase-1